MRHKALLPALLAASLLHAGTPDDTEIHAALAAAREAWGATQAIVIRSEPLNDCNLRDIPHIAEMQWQDVTTTMTTDDGKSTVSHALTYVIRLNSSCDWSKLSVSQAILHEVGHVVIGADWHSQDRHSIMYYIVIGKQSITAADRAMVRENREFSEAR